MLSIQQLGYIHPDLQPLFSGINAFIPAQKKVALVGDNGVGKSILLKLIAGNLSAAEGTIHMLSKAYYIPQIVGQFDHLTIAEALHVDKKLAALSAILNGSIDEQNYTDLDDDWTIEERCKEAFSYWQLTSFDMNTPLQKLSGGQKTKVFLSGLMIHQPELVLLDEPTNHLDTYSRQLLMNYVRDSKQTYLIVSHDRGLLNQMEEIWELTPKGLNKFGGNYSFFKEQKLLSEEALAQQLKNKEHEIRKAKQTERESIERQNKLNTRGKKKNSAGGIPTIMLNKLRNSGEASSAKLKAVHADKKENLVKELDQIKDQLIIKDGMRLELDNTKLHFGKKLIQATDLNFSYGRGNLWKENFNFEINCGQRLAIKGGNGSGKSTLLNLITQKMPPTTGSLLLQYNSIVYIDQDYSLLNDQLTVFGQAEFFNKTGLLEHEINIYLTRFLFYQRDWNKSCSKLSGGEKMRLLLCCINIQRTAPDIIILDEPTNNLDIQSIEILTEAIKAYKGTLLVVSHDQTFLEDLNIQKYFDM
jgi:ATPase subunit of ABC transporter with duplicated ATPase domains